MENNFRTAVIVGSLGDKMEISECIQRVLNILRSDVEAVFFQDSKFLGCLGAMLRREQILNGLVNDTVTMTDFVDDETYTKLRVATPPYNRRG